jgi:hypothetical protein
MGLQFSMSGIRFSMMVDLLREWAIMKRRCTFLSKLQKTFRMIFTNYLQKHVDLSQYIEYIGIRGTGIVRTLRKQLYQSLQEFQQAQL